MIARNQIKSQVQMFKYQIIYVYIRIHIKMDIKIPISKRCAPTYNKDEFCLILPVIYRSLARYRENCATKYRPISTFSRIYIRIGRSIFLFLFDHPIPIIKQHRFAQQPVCWIGFNFFCNISNDVRVALVKTTPWAMCECMFCA